MPYYHGYDSSWRIFPIISVAIFVLAIFGLLAVFRLAIRFTRIRKERIAQSFGIITVFTMVLFIIAIYFGINAIVYWLFDIGILILIGQIIALNQFLFIREPTIWAALPLIIAYVFLLVLGNSKENIPRK